MQQDALAKTLHAVTEEGIALREAVRAADLGTALAKATAMLEQLKSAILEPRRYQAVFQTAMHELQILQAYIREQYAVKGKVAPLYDSVQNSPSLIPRLYLMIVVGSVYMHSRELGHTQILEDLLEMAKAVQNPLRGIFLRSCFLQFVASRLPHAASVYETERYNLDNSLHVIFSNLYEMNRLWMRLQCGRDVARSIEQRLAIKHVLWQHFQVLGRLAGLDAKKYELVVLPKVVQIINKSPDSCSQQFFLESLINYSEPAQLLTFHSAILNLLAQGLEAKVDRASVFALLLEKLKLLVEYQHSAFDQTLHENLKSVVYSLLSFQDSALNSNLRVMLAFLRFTVLAYRSSAFVNQILQAILNLCSKSPCDGEQTKRLISQILGFPLALMSLQVLNMEEFPKLMKILDRGRAKEVAKLICNSVANTPRVITDEQSTAKVMSFLGCLASGAEEIDKLEEEQHLLCKLLYSFNEQSSLEYQILMELKRGFSNGGERREVHTKQALFYCSLRLASKCDHTCKESEFVQCAESCLARLTELAPVVAIRLHLQLITYQQSREGEASSCSLLLKRLFKLYSEELTDSQEKKESLEFIIGYYPLLKNTSHQEKLYTQCTSFAGKLLRKHDQAYIYLQIAQVVEAKDKLNELFSKASRLLLSLLKDDPSHFCLLVMLLARRISANKILPVKQHRETVSRELALGRQITTELSEHGKNRLWLECAVKITQQLIK